jgi:hypothetical protein
MLDRALAKSMEQVAANNLPRVLRQNPREVVWGVASRVEAGVVYLVTQSPDGQLACDCPAESICWHLCHVDRAIRGEIGHTAVRLPRLTINLLDIQLTGKRVTA